MRIVVTGGDGFIGQNLRVRLRELGHGDVVNVTRRTSDDELASALSGADFVFHLAGANRPQNVAEFAEVNADFTARVCAVLRNAGRAAPLVYTSSTQATRNTPYGESKRAGEEVVERYRAESGAPVFILRLSNVFGKWARPNYNSAVATFCHNLARDIPITVNDPAAPLTLLYIDDVVAAMIGLMAQAPVGPKPGFVEVEPAYATTVGELAETLGSFARSRRSLLIPRVGAGLPRALYATYVSYLPPEAFAYKLHRHADARGTFVEVLKTCDSGQFSYFTASPGVTRGEHYHHTKTEKFLVVQGSARFGFRHVVTNDAYEVFVEHQTPRVVETVPGWAHDVTNVGTTELIVLLWANEIFDPAKPDTVPARVKS